MARKPQVRFYASRNAFYCQHHGKQHRLGDGPDDFPDGPNYLRAFDVWRQLMSLDHVEKLMDQNTFRVIGELYLRHLEPRRPANTFKKNKRYLNIFCKDFGETPLSNLTRYAVTSWLDRQRSPGSKKGWGDSSIISFVNTLHATLNWAVENDLLTKNPLKGIEVPSKRSRGVEALMQPADHLRLLNAASKWMKPVLIVLEGTGCRPGEVINFSSAHFDAGINAMRFLPNSTRPGGEAGHKTGRKGKVRTIYLSGDALAVVKDHLLAYPSGPIFRTRLGRKWSVSTFDQQFAAVRDRLHLDNLTPYSYRHTFATQWLQAGRSIDLLAELLGNSAEIIREHYAHLCGDRHGLSKLVQQFNEQRQTPEAGSETPTIPFPGNERLA